MAGARRNALDSKGYSPRDMADMRGATDISSMLKDQNCLSSFNPLKTPLQPPKNNLLMFGAYHVVLVGRYLVLFLLLLPYVWWGLGYGTMVICVVTFILFELVSNINPGFIEAKPGRSLIYLYEKYNGDYVCSYCEVKRPGHARHCQHCNRCVKV